MNGYSSHTYSWINAGGERYWVYIVAEVAGAALTAGVFLLTQPAGEFEDEAPAAEPAREHGHRAVDGVPPARVAGTVS